MTETAPDATLQIATDEPELSTREQFIRAAGEHFSKYGYAKTTLADLSKAIGFSKTYVYRFFKSKQEIGEAICSLSLDFVVEQVEIEVDSAKSSHDKIRKMLGTVISRSAELFFNERKLHDISAASFAEEWESSSRYRTKLEMKLKDIIREGREAGEFERKTPIDELCRAILLAMQPFIDPRVLEFNLDLVPERSNEVIALILRSLAP